MGRFLFLISARPQVAALCHPRVLSCKSELLKEVCSVQPEGLYMATLPAKATVWDLCLIHLFLND